MTQDPRIEREPGSDRDKTVIDEVPTRRDEIENPLPRQPIDDRGRWDERQEAPGAPGPSEADVRDAEVRDAEAVDAEAPGDAGAVGGAVAGGAGGVIAGGALAGPPGAIVGGALGAAAGALVGQAADESQ